jgi:mono/diheme cytochrome c family protein
MSRVNLLIRVDKGNASISRVVVILLIFFLVALTACGTRSPMAVQRTLGGDANDAHAAHQENHTVAEAVHADESHSPADHMGGDHNVPAESAAVVNPVAASKESIASGAAIFSQNCAVCHGNTGKGDGPGAAGLNPKPADLHADHVQGNSDGTLFWIITHGRTGTAMAAWEAILSEEQRWDTVNFLRALPEQKE